MWKSLVPAARCPRLLWHARRQKFSVPVQLLLLQNCGSSSSFVVQGRSSSDGSGRGEYGARRGGVRAARAEVACSGQVVAVPIGEHGEHRAAGCKSAELAMVMVENPMHHLHHPRRDGEMLTMCENHHVRREFSTSQPEDHVRPPSHWSPLSGRAEYRRRRTRLKLGGGDGGSLREFSHRAASETYLVTRLAFTLLKLLGIGTRWIGKFIRLSLYAVFLMPGFIQVGFFYFFDKRIYRSITYGDQPRNRFDLYLPPESDKPKPVVIFITGGAWVIGYKAWGSLLAQQLVERDVIVACIDYRNFPQGSISDMIADVSRGIGYVYQNIENYGGDPNMVYLAGQSAGAHLAACALLMQAEKEISEGPESLVWRASKMKSYMAISGGYNLVKLVEYFHSRGLYKSIMLRVMEGEQSLPIYSPEFMVQTPTFKKAVPLLPPITLFHGTGDYSIPHEASENFAAALQAVGAQVNTVFYPDKTHTDLFLQDPMRGGKDELLADILDVVHANDEEARAEDVKNAHLRRRLVPEILLQLARRVSPF